MTSGMVFSLKLLLLGALFQYSVSADSMMGGHLDNEDLIHPDQKPEHEHDQEQPVARTRSADLDLDLDLASGESVPSPSALISDGLQFRMPGLFAFNGGKPFSLEKDPITGKIDFEKAPLKTLNYTADSKNDTDYDLYDEESYVTDVQSDDIYDKKNIDRKDGSIDGTRPNEINPYSPSFHDFLNLPVHYSSGKYSKEKYPLISSSYANTKVQSGLNSYNTYNHRPYVETETATRPALYFTTHKTYLPKTTMNPTTILRPSSTWETSPSTKSTMTTTTTTTTSTTTTTQRPTTTTTTQPSTQKPTPATLKPTTYAPMKPTTIYTPIKPSAGYSSLKPPSTTQESHNGYAGSNYGDGFKPFKPMPETGYGKKPVDTNIPMSQNSHARPVVSDEYDDHYDYYNFDDSNSEEGHSSLTSTVVPTTARITTMPISTTTITEKQQSSGVPMRNNNHPSYNQGATNFTTNLVHNPVLSYTQTVSTEPPSTSLPLGDNHPEKPFQPYGGNPLVHNPPGTTGDKTRNTIPESQSNPVRFYDHSIINNVKPDLSISINSRPYENGNGNGNGHGHVRPLNVNPNGMKQVESTSSVLIPPGQDTVSFVLGNQQNVDGGHFVGSAMRESPYGSKNEGGFQPTYNSQNVEQRPPQTITLAKNPVALASVAVNPKPIFVTEVGQHKPNPPNNIDQHTSNFNPQNRPLYPPKINGVEPPNPNPLASFVNPPPPYLETALNSPSTVLTGTSSPVRLNIAHPQSGPSENSLNLGVRTSLNAPSLNVGSRPFQNDLSNIRNVPVEASLNLGVRPFSDSSVHVDRTSNHDDKNTVISNSNDNSQQNAQSGYVVFPGNSQERPVEEHVIVINEADGSVQEFSSTIKGTPQIDRSKENEENLPKLSEDLTPPDKPIDRPLERPSGPYPPRPFDGRPRPYYPQRPDYLRPPRLPPHSKSGPPDSAFKRPLHDPKLPNILPQFRPNAKASHGHYGSELIGTIPAPYGPGRQPMLGRRNPPQYLQRLSPPPLPHALRLVSDGDPGFREPVGKEGPTYQDSLPINEHYQGHPISDNQRFRSPVSDSQQYSNSSPDKERFQESGSIHKRFRVPPTQNERFQGFPATAESDQFSEQKLRRNDETDSEEVSGFERFSAEPPQIPSRPLVNRRSGVDYRDAPQVATLQMIQQQGGLDERVVKPNLPPPFRVKFNKDGDSLDEDEGVEDNGDDEEVKRPVYVVYPVNSAVNIKDDAQNEDESVVVGTRGPHRPLPPDTLPSAEDDQDDGIVLPVLGDRPLLRPQNRPFSSAPIKSDFPYPLERPDPSLLITREKPLLVPSDKIDEDQNDNEDEDEDGEDAKKHDDTSINLIPYLQDYMPFPMRKTETPALPDKPSKSENLWPPGDSDSRIISKPAADDTSVYRAPISATLKTMSPTTVGPIAYAYTPTDDTPEYPKLGIRPSELIEMMPEQPKEDKSNQNPILPSQQPSSSSSSAPSPQNFMAPFLASVSAEAPSSNGWNVVSKVESNDRSDVEAEDQETQTEQSEFDIENFKPQLFGGFKPIYEFPMDNDSASKVTEIPETQQDKN